MKTVAEFPSLMGGGLLLLLQPPIGESRNTSPTVALMSARRLRGNANSIAIPRTAAQTAARNHGNAGPRGERFGALSGAILPTVAESKLAGAITVN